MGAEVDPSRIADAGRRMNILSQAPLFTILVSPATT
jgi:hypothetical protein